MRIGVVLCAAASALQYDASALRRALGAAKPLRNGAVIFRREWREKAGDDAAADAVYDALTRGAAARRSSRLTTWRPGRTIKEHWTPP